MNEEITPVESSGESPGSEEKFLGGISYIPMGFILPMASKPSSAFCKFHAKQGLTLLLGGIVSVIVLAILGRLLGGWIVVLFLLGYVLISIYAGFKAFNGETWSIPLISKFTAKLNLEKMQNLADQIPLPKIGGEEKASPEKPAVKMAEKSAELNPETPEKEPPQKTEEKTEVEDNVSEKKDHQEKSSSEKKQ